MTTTSESGSSGEIEKRSYMDADWGEYSLAGKLLGSEWEFPDGETKFIGGISYEVDESDDIVHQYPNIEFEEGYETRVSGFRSRINPYIIGDIDPAGEVSHEIVKMLTT